MNYLSTTLYRTGKDVFVVLEEITCMYDTPNYGVIICKNGTKLQVNMFTSEFIRKLRK